MARWNSCNVLHSTSDAQHLWQFSAGGKFPLQRDEKRLRRPAFTVSPVGESAPQLWIEIAKNVLGHGFLQWPFSPVGPRATAK